MNPVDEKIIIKKLKAGDNEAYKYLYDYHYVALCKLSYYMLKDKIQAESIVSDVIFHLWEIRENLELVPPLRNYLIIAVRNKCLNYLALKNKKWKSVFLLWNGQESNCKNHPRQSATSRDANKERTGT